MPKNIKTVVETIRDGAISATILRIETEIDGKKITLFPVMLGRVYEDKTGQAQRSRKFMGTELLRVARLAQKAYDRSAELDMAERSTID